MKRTHTILILFLATLFYTSCQKYSYIETELHGLWQVISVEDKTTNETTEAQGELYYSFQRNMVIVGYNSPNKPTGTMMTQYISDFYLNNDTIQISNFRVFEEYDKKAPLQALKRFGIHDEQTVFAIEHPRKDIMALKSAKARVTMRRY